MVFWSRYNVFHRCRSLWVIGYGQRQVGPQCATWRITLQQPTNTNLLPPYSSRQTKAHTVIMQGCSLRADREGELALDVVI